jgi:ABC-type lipoprotein export system ATPase subunit
MKIIKLEAENVKRLKAVEITPAGNVVEITGKNGQGKTSVLDSIYWALAGTKNIQAQPIRKGEEKATIKLSLGELIVTRRFTAKGSTVIVEKADGARFPSPQGILDAIVGELSFDPLAFARMAPKDQFEELRRIAKLGDEIDALDGRNKTDYEARTEINRKAKEARGAAARLVFPTDLPAEPIDEAQLLTEMQEVGEFNTQLEQRRSRREQAQRDADTAKASAQTDRERAAELRRQADAMDQRAQEQEQHAASLQAKIDAAEALPDPKDAAVVRAKLTEAQRVNQLIAVRQNAASFTAEADKLEAESLTITNRMAAREDEKAKIIAAAEMPIAGLSLGDGHISYNGIPFDQASAAEQLRVSIAIAIAANPKLRVLRITDGSLLDSDAMDMLAEMAEANDFQIWIERVDSSGKIGIVIEDGAVKGAGEPTGSEEAAA